MHTLKLGESIEILYLAKQLCTSAIPSLNDSKSPIIIGVLVTLIVLSITSVILRVVARKISKINLWWDDYLIIMALVKACTLERRILTDVITGSSLE